MKKTAKLVTFSIAFLVCPFAWAESGNSEILKSFRREIMFLSHEEAEKATYQFILDLKKRGLDEDAADLTRHFQWWFKDSALVNVNPDLKISATESVAESEREKIKRLYDTAPERRADTDKIVSGSPDGVRINNNTESPKIERILKQAGWGIATVTEGVKIQSGDSLIFRLEVIDGEARDWYVVIETDRAISSGRVISKSSGSPW
jgi:hypothetical protein